MACAPWIKWPGEKARHLGSLPLCCVCVGGGQLRGGGEQEAEIEGRKEREVGVEGRNCV